MDHDHGMVMTTTMTMVANTTMDMANMDHSDMGGMGIIHFGYKETIVIGGWVTNDVGAFIGSCICLFCVAFIFEGIRFVREHYLKHKNNNSTKYDLNEAADGSQQNDKEKRITYLQRILKWAHLLQTGLYFVQVLVAYFLMLAFMTYNFWICLSILLGKLQLIDCPVMLYQWINFETLFEFKGWLVDSFSLVSSVKCMDQMMFVFINCRTFFSIMAQIKKCTVFDQVNNNTLALCFLIVHLTLLLHSCTVVS